MSYKFKVISVPIHLGDWETGTLGWDATEHGAYWNLTRALYSNDGRIPVKPDNRLMRIAGCKSHREWTRVKLSVMPKFTVVDGFLAHHRVDEEIAKIKTKSALAKRAAKTRHGKKTKKNNVGALRTHSGGNANHKPLATYDINIIEAFENLYAEYPATPHSSKPKAQEAWIELSEDEQRHASAVIAIYVGSIPDTAKHIPAPQTWIREKRFQNYNKPQDRKGSAKFTPPIEGTPERVLYDTARECEITNATWHSWFSPDKIIIEDDVIYTRNEFLYRRIAQDFGKVIARAGMRLAAPGESKPAKVKEETT